MSQSSLADEFATRHLIDLGRARVCHRRAGQGPALVLLHGFPLSGLTWRKVVAVLGRRFTCHAFDLIGLGDSISPEPKDFSSEGQALLFRQALTDQGVSSYALLGNDTGGWIARELALIDPTRVTRLVLTNTEIPGHRPPWIPLYQEMVRLPGSAFVMRLLLSSRIIRRSGMGFGGCFVNLDLIEGEFGKLFVQPLLASPAHMTSMRRFLREMKFARLDRFAELHRKLSMPVAFVWATSDPTFPEPAARAMVAQFPHVAGFWSIPGAKLFLQEEQPEALAQRVLEFLHQDGAKP
jgi:haloalkane dehalogenase